MPYYETPDELTIKYNRQENHVGSQLAQFLAQIISKSGVKVNGYTLIRPSEFGYRLVKDNCQGTLSLDAADAIKIIFRMPDDKEENERTRLLAFDIMMEEDLRLVKVILMRRFSKLIFLYREDNCLYFKINNSVDGINNYKVALHKHKDIFLGYIVNEFTKEKTILRTIEQFVAELKIIFN